MDVMRFYFLLLAIVATASVDAVAGDGGVIGKPQVPIRLQFGAEGPVAVGSEMTITLTVTPLVQPESVTVVAVLPEGMRLVNGETVWTGTLAKEESHTVTMTVRPEPVNPSIPQIEVKGKATLTLPNGAQVSRLAVLTLDLNPTKPKSRLRERPGPGGQSILEIPLPSDPMVK
ncbi:MAG: hypothetical protein HY204_11125 [Nitrospirae bacterium]|nr:hypothetical protein [Nitrospirota bacterium]